MENNTDLYGITKNRTTTKTWHHNHCDRDNVITIIVIGTMWSNVCERMCVTQVLITILSSVWSLWHEYGVTLVVTMWLLWHECSVTLVVIIWHLSIYTLHILLCGMIDIFEYEWAIFSCIHANNIYIPIWNIIF